jgi:hypothetical protein
MHDADPTWLKELWVERFQVDLDPGQIVRWITAEHKAAACASTLLIQQGVRDLGQDDPE